MLIETTSIWSCHVIDQYGAEGPRECRAVEGGQASCHDMLQSPNLDAGYPQDADLRSSPPPPVRSPSVYNLLAPPRRARFRNTVAHAPGGSRPVGIRSLTHCCAVAARAVI